MRTVRVWDEEIGAYKYVDKALTIHDTLALAYEMHAGVSDWTGLPYIMHPIAVMQMLPPECDEEDKHIALLHDVVEDCAARLALKLHAMPFVKEQISSFECLFEGLIRYGYSDYTVRGLRLLTRDMWPGLSYIDYVRNIIDSGHIGAMWVKYCDNKHNTDPARCAHLTPELKERAVSMAVRYERSKKILREALGIDGT